LALFDRSERIGGLGSWEWVPQTGELFWSDNLFRLFGREPASVSPTAEWVVAHTHPRDRERVTEALRILAAGGELDSLDYRIVRQDGVIRHLQATFATFDDAECGPPRLVGSVADVTARHRVDRKLRAYAAVSSAMSEWDEFESGAERLLGGLAEALDLAFGVLWAFEGAVFTPRVLWHLPSHFAGVAKATERWRPGPGSPILGRAWEGGQPVVSSRPWEGSSPQRAAAIRESGLQAVIAIPAVSLTETLAVLEFLSCDPVDPTDRLLATLTGISHEIGYVLARRHGDLVRPVLTPRQLQMLQLAATGHSAANIALLLSLSPATVKRHFADAYARLGVSDRVAAVGEAMREGLIS
jgi:DNA-binding CsgD family transcriptional regulator